MNKIIVGLAERSYPIWIGEEIYADLGAALDEVNFPKKVAIVTNILSPYRIAYFEELNKQVMHIVSKMVLLQ